MKNTTLMLLATTILSAAALQANAAAPKEPEIHFYPAKSWIVGNGATPADCVVQSEFNNGFVLQFDGTKDWVQTLTINFRQNIFTPGKSYNVTLNIPGKLSRQVAAGAASAMTLSIPLKNDKDIYNNARSSSVLDVKIEDNNFRFFLVNFATAASKFETCMAGGDMGAGTTAPAAAAEPQPVSAPEPLEPPPPQREASNTIPQQQPAAAPERLQLPPEREVSDAIPQGAAAPPPPNASNIELIASLNESIAMEERETAGGNVPVTEILPEDPKPTVQRIPYTETVKLGDQVVTDDNKSPAPTAAPYRKRMSEQLAEEMATNRSTAALFEEAQADPVMPVPVDTAESISPEPVHQQPIETTAAPEPMAVPPTIEETRASPPPSPPPSFAETPKPAPTPVAEASIPAPAAVLSYKASPSITPEQARAMAAAQHAGQPLGLVQDTAQPAPSLKPIAEAAPAKPQPADLQPIPQPIPQEDTLEQADLAPIPSLPSPDEPFSGKGEIIKTDKAPRAATPFVPPVSHAKTERYESPQIQVNKESYEMTADMTGGEELPPVLQGGEPKMRRKADPEMLMKISQLERKINDLENENSALQGNMSSSKQEAVSIETENWNLERATARYNEAERQIKRLGEQLQRERALRASEKKDLESQLFDPQITEQQQLARLAELEQKLDEAEGKLEQQRIRYEERLRSGQAPGARATQ
ncbi:MAG: hypothetical protein WBK55_07385 [Alphaproteobacteria bacterium]